MGAIFKINGSVVLINNDLSTTGVLTNTINTTSSANISNTILVNSSSWTAIDQGAATNFRCGYFNNIDISASVLLTTYTGSVVGGGFVYSAILQPSDTVLISWSGSTNLYAKTINNPSSSYLQYMTTQA